MAALNAQLDEIVAQTIDVGQRQRDIAHKRDKCLPRERINRVLDPGTPFLEIGQLAGYNTLGDEESVPRMTPIPHVLFALIPGDVTITPPDCCVSLAKLDMEEHIVCLLWGSTCCAYF